MEVNVPHTGYMDGTSKEEEEEVVILLIKFLSIFI